VFLPTGSRRLLHNIQPFGHMKNVPTKAGTFVDEGMCHIIELFHLLETLLYIHSLKPF
jgi:hypothetical protein